MPHAKQLESWLGERQQDQSRQFPINRNEAAELFEISPSTLNRRLDRLVEFGCIRIISSSQGSIVEIVNWDEYQNTKNVESENTNENIGETDISGASLENGWKTDGERVESEWKTDGKQMETIEEGKEVKEGEEGRECKDSSTQPSLFGTDEPPKKKTRSRSRKKKDADLYTDDFRRFFDSYPEHRRTDEHATAIACTTRWTASKESHRQMAI